MKVLVTGKGGAGSWLVRGEQLGTAMEGNNLNYPRKNWASLMLVNCGHPLWHQVDPALVSRSNPLNLLQMPGAVADHAVGDLPACWNVLADEGHPIEGAKLLHWTAGIPGFEHYRNAPAADRWHAARAEMEQTA